MQISIVNETENIVRLALKEVNTTVIEAIIDGLNKNSDVVYARYIVDHPDLTDPMLEIKVKDGASFKEAIKKATEEFTEYFSAISE